MKRNIVLIVAMLCICMCLGACGNDEPKKTDSKKKVKKATEKVEKATSTDAEKKTKKAEMDEEGFYKTNDYVVTVGDTINVRVEASTDANIYALLGGGEVLNRTGYNDEWTRVLMDNTNFYIHSDLVEETEAPALPIQETPETASDSDAPRLDKKIMIDPGNQTNPNVTPEEIGPGSETTKQGCSTGNTGSTLGTKEYELNLIYANELKDELEKRGYEVTLTREENNVDLSNKSRALLANESDATTLIRIQTNFSTNSELSGLMAVTMTPDSPYNSDLYADSNMLATRLLQGTTTTTGAINNGIFESNDFTFVNWSDIPVVVMKIGYLSNKGDEENLNNKDYRRLVIKGLADGLDLFYK